MLLEYGFRLVQIRRVRSGKNLHRVKLCALRVFFVNFVVKVTSRSRISAFATSEMLHYPARSGNEYAGSRFKVIVDSSQRV